jgi:protein-S-isoprenylcysteine O-methyltransferase Ste14
MRRDVAMIGRCLAAILLLPGTVLVLVPVMIIRGSSTQDTRWTLGWPWMLVPWGAGGLLGLGGFALWAWCVWLFARVGRGTLAPWDPTEQLVVVGPYRHVRNPMISGVVAMLLAEGLFFGSIFLLAWAIGFWLLNHVYFLVAEEPGLLRRFGEPYRRYLANVPRWIPRRSPWLDASRT